MARGSLAQAYPVTTSQTSMYQAISIARAQIQKAQLVNGGGAGPVTVDIWITPDNTTTPDVKHLVLSQKQIAVDQTYIATELIGEYVENGGHIYIQADATGVAAWVDGNTIKAD